MMEHNIKHDISESFVLEFIQEQTGEYPVFPGHPLVLATTIMKTYRSFDDATRQNALGALEALCDRRIPGAGDQIMVAIECLSMGRDGASPEEMIHFADNCWNQSEAGGDPRSVESGSRQAMSISETFCEMVQNWIGRQAFAAA